MAVSDSERLLRNLFLLFGTMNTIQIWSLVVLLAWSTTAFAQIQIPPKKEYKLVVSKSVITIPKGQQDSVKLTVLRSKSFRTGKTAVAVDPPAESNLKVNVKQLTDVDQYMLYLTTTANTKTGEYHLLPTCILKNKRKAIVLKLVII